MEKAPRAQISRSCTPLGPRRRRRYLPKPESKNLLGGRPCAGAQKEGDCDGRDGPISRVIRML